MNKKLVVKNKFGEIVYCVLSDEEPYEKQLQEVVSVRPGHGYSVSMDKKKVTVRDYFAGETVGEFEILSFRESGLPQTLTWQKQ